ncbi:hypothetical protein [Fictibacillus phosphorivorans]|nr:hypothetical protein [Fictibacillus phosphorivorans]
MKKVKVFGIIFLFFAISPAAKVMSPTTTDSDIQLSHFIPEPQILVE